jgi:hypothetical protein
VVAFLQRLDAAPHPFDDAGSLVTEQCRKGERNDLVLRAHIRVADPGRNDANDDLVVSGIVDREVSRVERCAL